MKTKEIIYTLWTTVAFTTGIWLFNGITSPWSLIGVFAGLFAGLIVGLFFWLFRPLPVEIRWARWLLLLVVGLSVVAPFAWGNSYYPGVGAVSSGLLLAGAGFELLDRILHIHGSRQLTRRVLIVGGGEAGRMLLREIRSNPSLDREVVGFLDDDPNKYKVEHLPVLGETSRVTEVCREYNVDEVIIAMPSVDGAIIRQITRQAARINAHLRIVPGIREIIEGDVNWNQIREVKSEDLLGRETVEVDDENIHDFLRGKKVLVTGAAGSIGSCLVEEILKHPVHEVLGVDFNESALYELQAAQSSGGETNDLKTVLMDIRDSGLVDELVAGYKPDLILHAAALKHVPVLERFPAEGIKTNIRGTKNLLRAAGENEVEDCVVISTDKAVQPESIMGMTKRVGEFMVGSYGEKYSTCYSAVRFGNVLGSRGSVVPLFKRQIERGGPVTVTDPEVVRYFMTPGEAVKLVLSAASFQHSGAIHVLDLGDPIRILDLARQLISLSGFAPDVDIPIVYTGLREGEKMEEQLFCPAEEPEESAHTDIRRVIAPRLSDEQKQLLVELSDSPPENRSTARKKLEKIIG
ncbi:MAG: polysaccharide biosynthesis protein [bacterium]